MGFVEFILDGGGLGPSPVFHVFAMFQVAHGIAQPISTPRSGHDLREKWVIGEVCHIITFYCGFAIFIGCEREEDGLLTPRSFGNPPVRNWGLW